MFTIRNMDGVKTTVKCDKSAAARPMLSIDGMLTPVRLPDTSAFLEARPYIDRLIESHVVPLRCRGINELRDWLYETTEDTPQHVLMMSDGEPLGLVPRWARESDQKQLIIGLGRMDGPLVIGRNRTLALLGLVRTLQSEAAGWDVILAPGTSLAGDLRRLETAARCEKLPVRTIPVESSSVLVIPSPSGLRSRWTISASSDASLIKRWKLADIVGVSGEPEQVLQDAIPVLRVVFDPDPHEDALDEEAPEKTQLPEGSRPSRRQLATRPPLRVIRPS